MASGGSKKKSTSKGSASATGEDANIGKVRELLFGAQARDLEARLARIEERMAREISAIREETEQRLSALEGFTKGELQSLKDADAEEQRDRSKEIADVSKESAKGLSRLEKMLETTRGKLKTSETALREALLEESKKLGAEIQRKTAEGDARLESQSEMLRDAMVHRATLGDLLMEVGLRLKDEFEIPTAD